MIREEYMYLHVLRNYSNPDYRTFQLKLFIAYKENDRASSSSISVNEE